MTAPVPPPGDHGGDGLRIAAALGLDPASVVDLSTTLNPLAPDPAPVVARHLDGLGRYPDPSVATAVLADAMGVDRDRLLLTNGGAEAIALAGALLGGTVEEPDFSLYPRRPAPGALVDVPPRWRSNPHSPSGTLADPTGSGDPADRADVVRVWDEAFWPLATGTWTRGDHRRGAVVVGSLTKLLACPGLRVGYLLAPESDLGDRLVAEARRRQTGWSVGGLVCDALADLLAPVDLPAWRDGVAARRGALADELRRRGLRVDTGVTPWVLVHDVPDLRDRLARRGVVVRSCASFGLPGTVRIAVPNDRDLPLLLTAIDHAD